MKALALLFSLTASVALAEAPADRFSAGGYFRIMAQPDFQGGNGTLGYSTVYGRLLNEGPYAALELKLDVLQAAPGSNDTWASVHAKIEGGSVAGAEINNGTLASFRLSQLYVRAGNILLEHVTWQLGTLHYFAGDLGLYDLRPASLFYDTVGASAHYDYGRFELLVGAGDAGYAIRGAQYNAIGSAGIWGRVRILPGHLELGLGGQGRLEAQVAGNRFSPYTTPGLTYENYYRQQVVMRFLEQNPGQEDYFPNPVPTSATSYDLIGYFGFGAWGPFRWNNLFARFSRLHPDLPYVETYQGREYTIYVTGITNKRYQLTVGDEMQWQLIPRRLDAVLAGLLEYNYNPNNTIVAGTDNLRTLSAVLRLQLYLTQTVHLLLETSLAQETSLNGNLYREHVDSIFASTAGGANLLGLEFGDSNTRNTWQLKGGVVLNPNGPGIYTRPSLRLLFGLQYSSQQAAFGNGFVASLDENNVFVGRENHWHSVVALEAEEWF